MGSICAKWLEDVCAPLIKSAERRAPSAEAMTAPRAREQADPPSPPDRLPSRRGGSPSGLRRRMAGGLRRTAAALLVVLAAGVAFAPAAHAQDVTALQATMTVGFHSDIISPNYVTRSLGYIDNSFSTPFGSMNPSSFPVAGAPYTVSSLITGGQKATQTLPAVL